MLGCVCQRVMVQGMHLGMIGHIRFECMGVFRGGSDGPPKVWILEESNGVNRW